MTEKIIPLAEKVLTVKPNSDRAMEAHELSQIIRRYNVSSIACNSVKEAIENCLSDFCEDSIICIFGSLYFVGEAREYIISRMPNVYVS